MCTLSKYTLQYMCELYPLERHPDNSVHPVRYYSKYLYLGSSHIVR